MVGLGDGHVAEGGRVLALGDGCDFVEALLDAGEEAAVVVVDAELVCAQGLGFGEVERARLGEGLERFLALVLG